MVKGLRGEGGKGTRAMFSFHCRLSSGFHMPFLVYVLRAVSPAVWRISTFCLVLPPAAKFS